MFVYETALNALMSLIVEFAEFPVYSRLNAMQARVLHCNICTMKLFYFIGTCIVSTDDLLMNHTVSN